MGIQDKFQKWVVIKEPEDKGLMLLRSKSNPNLGTVVRVDKRRGKIESMMPCDWRSFKESLICDMGVRMITQEYSWEFACKVYDETK